MSDVEVADGRVIEEHPPYIVDNGIEYPLFRGNAMMGPEREEFLIGYVFIADNTIDDIEERGDFRTLGHWLADEVVCNEEGTPYAKTAASLRAFKITPDYDERPEN